MGSPLSGVLACIYLEFLEFGSFKYIIPNTVHYFRYIDHILLIYPQDLDLHSITDRLNNVEPSIKFTYELEYNSTHLFWKFYLLGILTNLNSRFTVNPPVKTNTITFIHTITTILKEVLRRPDKYTGPRKLLKYK